MGRFRSYTTWLFFLSGALVAPGALAQEFAEAPPDLKQRPGGDDADPSFDEEPQVAAPGPVRARRETQRASAVATVVVGPGARVGQPRDAGRTGGNPDEPEGSEGSLLHGFRLGYVFVANHDEPIDPDDLDSSLEQTDDLRNPHMFVIGYELAHRMAGSRWLNVLLIGNVSIAGLEQSKAFPSANFLLGFELDRAFQAGVGINLVPVEDKPAHMILAAGWTPQADDVYLPFHVYFIPDIDNNHRIGATIGVNWAL